MKTKGNTNVPTFEAWMSKIKTNHVRQKAWSLVDPVKQTIVNTNLPKHAQDEKPFWIYWGLHCLLVLY